MVSPTLAFRASIYGRTKSGHGICDTSDDTNLILKDRE